MVRLRPSLADTTKTESPIEMLSDNRHAIASAPDLERVICIDLETHSEVARGNLTVVQSNDNIPFSIVRMFYIYGPYGAPQNWDRGAHAHRESQQAFIAISGSFSLDVTNGQQKKTFQMKEPDRAIHVPPMIWARVYNFSSEAVCLVLTNTLYDASDYIRDWNEYLTAVGKL